MAVELRHFRYFVAVAEELHFGRAARRLNVSQPPLSQQIRQLEGALGVALFARTSRRVALTPAGTALLVGARRTLAEADRSLEMAQRAGRGSSTRCASALPTPRRWGGCRRLCGVSGRRIPTSTWS